MTTSTDPDIDPAFRCPNPCPLRLDSSERRLLESFSVLSWEMKDPREPIDPPRSTLFLSLSLSLLLNIRKMPPFFLVLLPLSSLSVSLDLSLSLDEGSFLSLPLEA